MVSLRGIWNSKRSLFFTTIVLSYQALLLSTQRSFFLTTVLSQHTTWVVAFFGFELNGGVKNGYPNLTKWYLGLVDRLTIRLVGVPRVPPIWSLDKKSERIEQLNIVVFISRFFFLGFSVFEIFWRSGESRRRRWIGIRSSFWDLNSSFFDRISFKSRLRSSWKSSSVIGWDLK